MGQFLSREDATLKAEELRKQGSSIALANGAFDILHVGHVRYLQAAAETADVLFVAVNSDSSVRGYKGEGRPVIPEAERAELLCALECVDYVILFDEPNVEKVILELRPSYQCKGTDYTVDTVPEGPVVRSVGGEVRIVGDPKDHNSSEIIATIAGSKGQ